MRMLLRVAVATALAAGSQANAAWYQASSRHFIIYANDSPKRLLAFASELERFDQAVRLVMHYDDPPVGDGNRLAVYVLPSVDAVQKLAGKEAGNILGFYQPRAEGCVAFVPKTTGRAEDAGIDAGAVFFHEYTHHLQFENLERPTPAWLVEGFAEFMQTAQFEKDGSVLLGSAPEERAWGLLGSESIPLSSLLTQGYDKLDDEHRDLFYGEGWLLTHYLFMTQSRSEQLVKYLNLLNSGTAGLEAAKRAFGDLDQLQHELTIYKHQRSIFGMKIAANRLQVPPVEVTPLSNGAAAVILLRADLKNHGEKKAAAQELAGQIQALELKYPGDELVEATLAEADLDAGNVSAAEAAADRVLKANPRDVEGLIYKGRAIEERGRDMSGSNRHDMFEEARSEFIAANKIDTEDPEPLYDFYTSFLHEGIRPTDNAISAMHYASDLVPQDFGLRMNSAIAYLNENKPSEARATLTVIAYSPHSERTGDVARRLISAIDAGKGRAALEELRTPSTQTSASH